MKSFKSLVIILLFLAVQTIPAQQSQANKSTTSDSLKKAKEYLRLLKAENKSGANDNFIAREQKQNISTIKN